MNSIRTALTGFLLLIAAAPLGTHAEGFVVDEATGIYSYRYALQLPAARGRFQPSVTLLSKIPGHLDSPMGCMASNIGLGNSWLLDFPSLDWDGTNLWLNQPEHGRKLLPSTRDGTGLVADIETSYLSFNRTSPDTVVATDAAGNTLTFRTACPIGYTCSLGISPAYRLARVADADGNVTVYTWDNSRTYLQRIDYNAFKTAEVDRSTTSQVGETGNWGASAVLTWTSGTPRLDHVEVMVNVTPGAVDPTTRQMIAAAPVTIRRYQLNYNGADPNWLALMSIVETGTVGGTEQLVTTFQQDPALYQCLATVISPTGARQDIAFLNSYAFGDPAREFYPVVKSITTSGPGMATGTVNYWYASPQRLASGEYRGFAQTWSQDAVTGLVKHSTWDVASRPFVGQPLSVEIGTQAVAGTSTTPPTLSAFRTLTFTHEARSVSTGACTASPTDPPSGAYPLLPVTTSELDQRTVDGVTLGSKRTTPCSQVDAWGNAQQVQIDPDTSIVGDELTVNSVFLVDVGPATCKNCLKSSGTYSGASLLEWTELSYSATGLLSRVQRQSVAGQNSSTYPLVSSYGYFPNGNLSSKTEGGTTYVYTYDDWFQARVIKAEAIDISVLGKELVTETSYDAAGRPILTLGPYYLAPGYPLSAKPARSLAYDSLGRLVAIARQPINGTSVTEGLAAFKYTSYSGATPASVTAYQFAVPRSFLVGAPPDAADVRQITTFMDGVGRSIQARERLGGTAADPAAAIVQSLGNYRVTGAVLFDGAGRVAASVAPYYSSNAGYQDLTSVSMAPSVTGEVIRGPVQATWRSYDALGRQVCSTVRAVTTTLPTSAPPNGACTSSFAEDAGYARATRTIYRGTTVAGRTAIGIKTIDPRFTVAGGVQVGPESFVDAAGLLRNVTDVEGNGTTYQYDALGRATATVRQAPGSTRASVTSSVLLDMMGRVLTRTDPNLGGRTFTYDAQSPGLLKVVRFTKTGEEVRYDYDMGRVKSVQFCTAAGVCTTDAAMTWDLPYSSGATYTFTAGRLGSASNAQSTLAFSYDDAGAMVRRDQWIGAGAFTFTATRRADGQVKQADFIPAPGLGLSPLSILASFDSAGRPAQIQAGTSTLWSATAGADGTGAYDAFGNLGAVQVDDARVQQAWTRGAASGLLTAQSVIIQGAANPVVYQVSGMTYRGLFLQGYTDNMNQTVQQYWYSNAGRLVASRAQDSLTAGLKQLSCLGYSTDDKFGGGPSFGNIEVVKEGSGAPTTATYSYMGSDITTGTSGPDAPTAVGTTSLTYDAFGRVATKGGGAETFSYDLAGRLLSATRTAGQSETLNYDPLGQLVSRTVNGQTTWYLGRMVTLTTVAGALQADVHVSANGGRVASIRVGSSPRTLYLHRDRLTSVVGTTLAGGVRGATYLYGPHGALVATTGDAGDAASELGYAGTLRLTGGLLLMGARIYDPNLKVFLQPDPLAPHSYTYAGGDPINRWDPTGFKDEPKKTLCNGGECPPPGPGPNGEGGQDNPVQLPEVVVTVSRIETTNVGPSSQFTSAPVLVSGQEPTQSMLMGPFGGGIQAGGGFSPGDLGRASGQRGGDGGGTGSGASGAYGGNGLSVPYVPVPYGATSGGTARELGELGAALGGAVVDVWNSPVVRSGFAAIGLVGMAFRLSSWVPAIAGVAVLGAAAPYVAAVVAVGIVAYTAYQFYQVGVAINNSVRGAKSPLGTRGRRTKRALRRLPRLQRRGGHIREGAINVLCRHRWAAASSLTAIQ